MSQKLSIEQELSKILKSEQEIRGGKLKYDQILDKNIYKNLKKDNMLNFQAECKYYY